MSLVEYRKRRNFTKTSEPRGKATKKKKKKGLLFVVQKHAARRLHYDFRLEWDGVLKSWAVPKGPSLDPSKRVLAVEVEDHPIEYGSFEGVIAEGEYGAGTVLLWDRGTWTPLGDPAEGFRKGKLEFMLDGEKLRGKWHLVRMGADAKGERRNWLLFKAHDEHAVKAKDYDILSERPESVKTGREIEEIAAGKGGRRNSKSSRSKRESRSHKGPAKVAGVAKAGVRRSRIAPSKPIGARKSRQPAWIAPQLARLVKEAPSGDEWLHEIKYDGYRFIAVKKGSKVRLLTRHRKDWSHRFPQLVEALARLPVRQAILDGEVVALNEKGISDFQALQNVMENREAVRVDYVLFDLLHCEGYDLTGCPLLERKRLLAEILRRLPKNSPLKYSGHVIGNGPKMLQKACAKGLEGIVSKRADGLYESKRSGSWLKVKCVNEQEFVIGGYTDPQGARTGFGALLLGYYRDGKLRYCGRVGTGFDRKLLADLTAKLRAIERKTPAFVNPPVGADARRVHWVKPTLVAQVKYGSITSDGILRHPSFTGLRADKPAGEVRLEVPVDPLSEHSNPGNKTKASRSNASISSSTSSSRGNVEVAGVKLSNPDRVLWPEGGFTKLDLAKYYEAVGELMLPFVGNRPLMLVRCPRGAGGDCFHQKHPSNSVPKHLHTVPIREEEGMAKYFYLDSVAGLVSLAQMSVAEIHTWGSSVNDLEHPNQMIFDLDPGPGVEWKRVVDAAILIRDVLASLGLDSFVKTTGGKGLHVVVPLRAMAGWKEVKAFARAISASVVQNDPQCFVGKMTKSIRAGRIYVDYLRNGRGATCVAPYSTRAKPGATVAMPVSWNALKRLESSSAYNLANAIAKAKRDPNPWEGYFESRQALTDKLLRQLQLA